MEDLKEEEEQELFIDLDELRKSIPKIKQVLLDRNSSIAQRFRSIFTLKNLGGPEAIEVLSAAFNDPSALLKHEVAYCLGQLQDERAIPILINVLEDKTQEAMVRHEAAEALGAISKPEALPVLEKYVHDDIPEVSETCQISIDRIKWFQTNKKENSNSPFYSVDPAPSHNSTSIEELKQTYLNSNNSLFQRYRAMFKLRDLQTDEAAQILAQGLQDSSALFRHEVAYVLGQLQNPITVEPLKKVLENESENPMVRHEAIEALGSIASPEAITLCQNYKSHKEPVVKESVYVALDISEYFTSDQFQYADKVFASEK